MRQTEDEQGTILGLTGIPAIDWDLEPLLSPEELDELLSFPPHVPIEEICSPIELDIDLPTQEELFNAAKIVI